jgi:hypothetical protein
MATDATDNLGAIATTLAFFDRLAADSETRPEWLPPDIEVRLVKNELLQIDPVSPAELWSLSVTPGDTDLRNLLYGRLGVAEARKRLAQRFPSGAATDEIERRVAARGAATEVSRAAVIEDLVNELVAAPPQTIS